MLVVASGHVSLAPANYGWLPDFFPILLIKGFLMESCFELYRRTVTWRNVVYNVLPLGHPSPSNPSIPEYSLVREPVISNHRGAAAGLPPPLSSPMMSVRMVLHENWEMV